MRLSELCEARRNPEINHDRIRDNINRVLQWAKPNFFATFTKLSNIGINPKTEYGTPIGIYCYPLWEKNIIENIEENSLPFAGDFPFITVMHGIGNIIELSSSDFTELNRSVVEWLSGKLSHLTHGTRLSTAEERQSAIWGHVYRIAAQNSLVASPAGIWWGFTRLAAALACDARDTHEHRTVDGLSYIAQHVYDEIKDDKIRGVPAMWTRLMLDIGIDGVVDNGNIIHANEPVQAVFFNIRAFKIVDQFENPRKATEEIKVVTSPSMLMKALRTTKNTTDITAYSVAYIAEYLFHDTSFSWTSSFTLKIDQNNTQPYISVIERYCRDRGAEYTSKVCQSILFYSLNNYKHLHSKRSIISREMKFVTNLLPLDEIIQYINRAGRVGSLRDKEIQNFKNEYLASSH